MRHVFFNQPSNVRFAEITLRRLCPTAVQRPPGSGKPISEPWGTDDPRSGGPTPKYFLNFSNPATRSWWLDKYVAPALNHPDIAGVCTHAA
jgi:hypothetical protein